MREITLLGAFSGGVFIGAAAMALIWIIALRQSRKYRILKPIGELTPEEEATIRENVQRARSAALME